MMAQRDSSGDNSNINSCKDDQFEDQIENSQYKKVCMYERRWLYCGLAFLYNSYI